MGLKKSIYSEVIIDASKEKIWNILTDFTNYKNWNPFIVESSGYATPGTILVNTMKTKKSTIIFKPVILNVQPFQYFDWLGTLLMKGIFDGHHYFKLVELGNGKVKLIQGENFSGILSGLLFRSIGEETQVSFVKMNTALKQMAEQKSGQIA